MLSGWATSPDTTGLYVPANGQHVITEGQDGYLDFYAAWDAKSSYILYLPSSVQIEEKNNKLDISSLISYFSVNSDLSVSIETDFKLCYTKCI